MVLNLMNIRTHLLLLSVFGRPPNIHHFWFISRAYSNHALKAEAEQKKKQQNERNKIRRFDICSLENFTR